MEVTPGVHTFPQEIQREDGNRTIHPSAVETAKGVILIDVGDPGEIEQIEMNLEEAGFDWNDVRAVILTHQDGDHVGTLPAVLERVEATVYAHQNATPYIDGREALLKYDDGRPYSPVDVDVELVDGVSFRTDAGPMDIVFTPGHAPGHIALYLPWEKLLLAADSMIATSEGLYGPYERVTLDMDEALDSAAMLAELDIQRVVCYHGGPVEADSDEIRKIVEAAR